MTDQLSAKDWLDQGLRTLATRGFTALKAEPLAKAMGVSRGSFYWHFADIGAFHSAILKHWRKVAAEQIIANLEAASDHDDPLRLLLRQAFAGEGGPHLGHGRPGGPRRGAGHRPAPAGLCGKPV
jgi:AcrR family transcriptional regulator